jgi:hypothetical protein
VRISVTRNQQQLIERGVVSLPLYSRDLFLDDLIRPVTAHPSDAAFMSLDTVRRFLVTSIALGWTNRPGGSTMGDREFIWGRVARLPTRREESLEC